MKPKSIQIHQNNGLKYCHCAWKTLVPAACIRAIIFMDLQKVYSRFLSPHVWPLCSHSLRLLCTLCHLILSHWVNRYLSILAIFETQRIGHWLNQGGFAKSCNIRTRPSKKGGVGNILPSKITSHIFSKPSKVSFYSIVALEENAIHAWVELDIVWKSEVARQNSEGNCHKT